MDSLRSIGHDVTVCEDNLGGGQFARPSGIRVNEATGELGAGVFHLTPATALGVQAIDDRSCCCSARRCFPISAAPLRVAHASSWTPASLSRGPAEVGREDQAWVPGNAT
jgi:hypothetical protein